MAGVGQADGEAEKHLNGELPPEPEDRDGAAGPGAEDGAKKKRKKKKKGKAGPAGRGRPPAGRVPRAGGTRRGFAAGGPGGAAAAGLRGRTEGGKEGASAPRFLACPEEKGVSVLLGEPSA